MSHGTPDRKLDVFLLGTPFCGSTLVGNVLNAHPDIFTVGETNRLASFKQFESTPEQYISKCIVCGGHDDYRCPVWTPALVEEMKSLGAGQALDALRRGRDERILVDCSKNPPWLREVIASRGSADGIRVIHVVRTPCAYVLNYVGLKRTPEEAASDWRDTFVDARRTCAAHGIPILTVHYEEFAVTPEVELARIGNFLGFEPVEEMHHYWDVPIHALGGNNKAYRRYANFNTATIVDSERGQVERYGDRPFGGWNEERWTVRLTVERFARAVAVCGFSDAVEAAGYDLVTEARKIKTGDYRVVDFIQPELYANVKPAGESPKKTEEGSAPSNPDLTADATANRIQLKFEAMFSVPGYRSSGERVEQARLLMERETMLAGASVVDFGCGNGDASRFFAEQGMSVLGIDIATNAVAPANRGTFPFLRANLWSLPIPLKADYGFCGDVLQAIPEERVDDVLAMIREAVTGPTFFDVSCRADRWGDKIGQRLHETVRPKDWWLAKLGLFWNHLEVVAEDDKDQSIWLVARNIQTPAETTE